MKKLLHTLLLTALIVICAAFLPTKAQAASESDLTFKLNADGQSYTVSDCKGSASGALTIPAIYNGKPVTSIDGFAFSSCSSLQSITIGTGITRIESYAFYNCNSLTGVYITDIEAWCNIDFQSSYANPLYFAKNLYLNGQLVTDLVIPEGVTAIGKYAFLNCTSLQSVSIPDSVTSIDNSAFSGCTSLNYNLYDNVKYLGNKNNPYIYLVKAESDITSAQIHPDTKFIGNSAFSGCTSLQSVVIPDGVTDIKNAMFKGCTSLKSVTIPDSVTSIGEYAFSGCTSLQKVTIGKNVTSIGSYAFLDCTSLTGVYITDIAAWCGISFGWLDSGSRSANPLYYAKNLYLNGQLATDLVIPEGVTSIGKLAFCNSSCIQSIVIPESVTSIGSQAFKNCSQLKNAAILEGVTELVYGTFQGCGNLEDISLPDTLKSIGQSSFESCTSLESITIPEGVTSIDDYAFLNCIRLQSFTIPANVTSFDRSALSGCSGLTGIWVDKNNAYYCSDSIGILFDKNKTVLIQAPEKVSGSCSIPASVTKINGSALSGCSGLTGIWVDENNANYSSDSLGVLFNKDKTTLIQVPGGLSGNCNIPADVVKVENSAFDGCSKLTGIVVDANNANYSSDSLGILYNKDKTKLIRVPGGFSGSYMIPDGVTSFDSSAFDGCSKLTGILAGENNANYSSDSFGVLYNKDKTKLIRVPGGVSDSWMIPDSVTVIGDYAFQTNGLANLTIPDSVTSIGTFSFLYCDNLRSVTLGKGITNIGWGAFSACVNLTEVYYRGTEEQKKGIYIEGYASEYINGAQWHYDVTDIVLGSQVVHQCSCCDQYQYSDASEDVFADISNTGWQSKFAIYACQKGLMAGKGTDVNGKIKFDPNNSITREEFVQVLYNAESKPSVSIANKFPDVGNTAWYKNAVLWANSKNIANGMGNGNFGVGKNITRQDLAMMLYKYAAMKNLDLTAPAGEINKYADGSSVAGYAQTAMNWAIKNGVLSGKGTAGKPLSTFKLDPAGTATRAECAAMLKNFMEAFGL